MTATTEASPATHPRWCDPRRCEREDATTNPKCHPEDVHFTHRSAVLHLHGEGVTGPNEPAHLKISLEMSAWDVDGYVEGPFIVFEGRDSLGDSLFTRILCEDAETFAPLLLAEIQRHRT